MGMVAFLMIIGVIWFFSAVSDAIKKNSDTAKSRQSFVAKRNEKYGIRIIDHSKSLYQRNLDIIGVFYKGIAAHPSDNSYYYMDNQVRDCINEICLAEDRQSLCPNSAFLSSWQRTAPSEWNALSEEIKRVFNDRQRILRELESKVAECRAKLNASRRGRRSPADDIKIEKTVAGRNFFADDLAEILTVNKESWLDKEDKIINGSVRLEHFPRFASEIDHSSVGRLNEEIDDFNKVLEEDVVLRRDNKVFFRNVLDGYKNKRKEEVIQRLNFVMNNMCFPDSMPRIWDIDFDPEQAIVIVEVSLPDVVHQPVYKTVELRSGPANKLLNQKEIKETVPKVHPAIILRVACEIYRNDTDLIKLLVVNGWVEFDDPSTGHKTKTYTASLAVEKDQILSLNLEKLDPLPAFVNLKGKTAGKLVDIVPVTPIMSLSRKDRRFIETRDVLNKLGSETNLASMDWQDFENLIAELFEKEFAQEGAEIKVTQASRDRGVDAVIFNPDPIKGGKYIVQAKRYAHTVDVSAVRDLCAVVKKEGASKGILVTTSTYGADAYSFANNEPITLLNGAELLGLLSKHGYGFRINLAEARLLNKANAQSDHEKL